MMFLEGPAGVYAVSQPAHAWVAGQLLRHWAAGLDEPLLFAAEQHDLAWLDWETAPVFDPATGRPKLFRDVGAADHAPLWSQAVERARAAWGAHVALLISRHGTVIYTRFTDRHRADAAADARAADAYVAQQTPMQEAWAGALGLSQGRLEHDTNLIAFADTLSLGLCGALPLPLDLDGPSPGGAPVRYRLAAGRDAFGYTLSPWPFAGPSLTIAFAARTLAPGGFASAADMRAWAEGATATTMRLRLDQAD
jgi:hypothetical protein